MGSSDTELHSPDRMGIFRHFIQKGSVVRLERRRMRLVMTVC